MKSALVRLCCSLVFAWTLTVQVLAFEVSSLTTADGIGLWHVEDKTVPLVAIEFAFDQGGASDPAGKEGAASLLSRLLDEGTTAIDGVTFRALRDDNAVRMGFSASADNFSGSLQVPRASLDVAAGLLAAALASPTLPEDAVERLRRLALVRVAAREKDPGSIAYLAASKLAFPEGHPYLKRTQGTTASLQSITRPDLLETKQRLFVKRNLKVSVVGDISREEAFAFVQKVFSPLPSGGDARAIDRAPPLATNQTEVIDWDMPQTTIFFGGNGIEQNDPDYFAAQVLMEILGGQSSRLYTELREKRGLTYSVDYGLFNFRKSALTFGSFSAENAKAGDAMELVRKVLADMRRDGPTADEVAAAKRYITGSYAFRYETLSSTASSLLGQMVLGLPKDYNEKRNADVNAVELAQVKRVAQRLIDLDRFFVVAIGKPDGITASGVSP